MFKAVIPDENEKGIVLVKGVPFGNPGDKDAHGQFFTPNTNFLQHVLPLPPVFHFHGAKTGSLSDPVGSTLSREQDNNGVMYKVKLYIDSAKEEVKKKALELWEAAKSGKLFASSGAVEAAIKVAESGEIQQWLVSELSLIDTRKNYEKPASFHATVVPVKMADHGMEDGDTTLDQLNINEEPNDGQSGLVTETVDEIYRAFRERVSNDPSLAEAIIPSLRSQEMSDNNDALTQLQQQVAEMTATMAQNQAALEERDRRIAELQGVITTKSAEVAMGTHMGMVDAWIKEGKLTPSEREPMLEVLSFAYQADTSTKGDVGFVSSVQKLIEARPVNPIMGSPASVYSNVGDLNGGASHGVGGGIDQNNINRLKRYSGITDN